MKDAIDYLEGYQDGVKKGKWELIKEIESHFKSVDNNWQVLVLHKDEKWWQALKKELEANNE